MEAVFWRQTLSEDVLTASLTVLVHSLRAVAQGAAPIPSDPLQQLEQLGAGEDLRERRIVVLYDAVHQPALALDDRGNFLFERAFGEQLENLHGAALAQAVHAVGRLVLAGGVPPAVVVDDGRGGGEVDADAAGAQAPQEDPAAGLAAEALEQRAASGGAAARTGQDHVADAQALQVAPHERDHAQELSEDDHLLAALQALR